MGKGCGAWDVWWAREREQRLPFASEVPMRRRSVGTATGRERIVPQRDSQAFSTYISRRARPCSTEGILSNAAHLRHMAHGRRTRVDREAENGLRRADESPGLSPRGRGRRANETPSIRID